MKKKHSHTSQLLEEFYNRPFDIRAETIAAIFLEQAALKKESICFDPLGSTGGALGKELAGFHRSSTDQEQVVLELYRNGPFEMLPAALFQSHSDIEEQRAARKFFRLLQKAFDEQAIEQCRYERDNSLGGSELLASLWSLPDWIPERQRSLLAHFLSQADEIIGNYEATAQCFKQILKQEVCIKEMPGQVLKCEEEGISQTGISILDSTFTIGQEIDDPLPRLLIQIGPLPAGQLRDFLPGGLQRKVLEEALYFHLLPAGQECYTQLSIEQEMENDSGPPCPMIGFSQIY